jgi:hypothetical protein
LLLIVAANLGRYARLSIFDPANVAHLLLALLCVLVTIFVWLLVLVWDTPLGLAAGMITVLAAGLVVQWGTAWRIGVNDVADLREPLITAATDDELILLIDSAVTISRQFKGAEQAVSLFSAVDQPLLRWYLRDFDRAEFGDTVPLQATYDLIIAPELSDPAFGTDYLGSDFGFLVGQAPAPQSTVERLRWFIFPETSVQTSATTAERLVLWVRSDLLQNEN